MPGANRQTDLELSTWDWITQDVQTSISLQTCFEYFSKLYLYFILLLSADVMGLVLFLQNYDQSDQ